MGRRGAGPGLVGFDQGRGLGPGPRLQQEQHPQQEQHNFKWAGVLWTLGVAGRLPPPPPPTSAQGFITGDAAAARHQTLPQLNNQPGPRGAARARTTHYSRKALLLRLKSLALSESAF